MSRVTRVRMPHTRTNELCVQAWQASCVESGYGYYLPLISIRGQPGSRSLRMYVCMYVRMCVHAFVRMRGYAAVFTQEKGRKRRLVRAVLLVEHTTAANDTQPDCRPYCRCRYHALTHEIFKIPGTRPTSPVLYAGSTNSTPRRYERDIDTTARRNETFLRWWRHLNTDKKTMVGKAFIIPSIVPRRVFLKNARD